jgi:cobalt/nickel transport system permease protein
MKVARLSRGFEERGIRDWKFIAGTAGALFVRSYERGERVHTSMIARGYTGELPKTETPEISSSSKFLAVGIPLAALIITSATGALS